jgi:hypothetical protein
LKVRFFIWREKGKEIEMKRKRMRVGVIREERGGR